MDSRAPIVELLLVAIVEAAWLIEHLFACRVVDIPARVNRVTE